NLAKSLFNVEGNSRLRRNKTFVIRITSIELLRFLEKIDESLLKNAKYKQIPKIIQRSPNFILKEFIKSLFDGEASVSKNKRAIVVVSASKGLIYDLRTLLLRFGIISQTCKTTSYAQNTKLKIRRDYWKLAISGKEIRKYAKEIGFTSIEKQKKLFDLINSDKVYNTNIDVVPGISKLLKELRKLLRLTQFDMGISRTTYQHLERGDRNPSRKVLKLIVKKIKERLYYLSLVLDKDITLDLKKIREELNLSQESLATVSNCSQTLISQYELKGVNAVKQEGLQKSLLNIIKNLIYDKHLISLVKRLETLAYSDIFWDQIKSIEKIKSDQEYVYDLTVDGVHNFVANNLFVHNSSLLMFISKIAPKARYVSGKGTSAAGITATVVKDEFLRGFALEAGALVLANGGFLMLDEMDKMATEDTSALHEAMAQQRISISKANIQATLKCETTILAAANPKFGRFDPYQVIASQINLPPALINRFDLIFPVRDLPNRELDSKIASHVLKLQKNPEDAKSDIPVPLMKKYISYARQKVKPVLTDEAVNEIHSFYVALRNSVSGGDAGVRPIPISARQLEALVRLAEANAKIRLDNEVRLEDAKKAIALLKKCLMEVGMDKETGQIDIDIISTGISSRQRNKIWIIRDIIEELGKQFEEGVPYNEITQSAKEKNISEKDVDEVITRLERDGDLFHPKPNFYAITKRPS
ncbi:helix-turn-helix domain-containing protein, partial [Candidatus Woesearchaeota archaeon]|nr:helix-turn-helix domain-containing protein [Candidatus Woesearchaeota archaeon]